MNKFDLIQALAEKEDLTLKMAERVVNTLFDLMAQSLAQGDRIEIRGFGCFQVKDYDGYVSRAGRPHFTREACLAQP